MSLVQHEVFAGGEGDRWFQRNRRALAAFDPASDLPLKLVEAYGLRPGSVLEVGAADGARLAVFAERFGARSVGVDVSQQAIEDGRRRLAGVEYVEAAAHDIPLSDPFELVIVHFVLHWIDRPLLLQVTAEVDRLTADGGHLIVGDFAPSNFVCVPYHHPTAAAVHTYKQDYAAMFLTSGLYHRVGMLSADHDSKRPMTPVDEHDRIAVSLLHKHTCGHYLPVAGPAAGRGGSAARP